MFKLAPILDFDIGANVTDILTNLELRQKRLAKMLHSPVSKVQDLPPGTKSGAMITARFVRQISPKRKTCTRDRRVGSFVIPEAVHR